MKPPRGSISNHTTHTWYGRGKLTYRLTLQCIVVFFLLDATSSFAADRLELEGASIQGTRELPKVLYIVPWKKSRIGTLAGVSERASFDSSMTSLDRDVLLQELKYYNILNGPELLSKK